MDQIEYYHRECVQERFIENTIATRRIKRLDSDDIPHSVTPDPAKDSHTQKVIPSRTIPCKISDDGLNTRYLPSEIDN